MIETGLIYALLALQLGTLVVVAVLLLRRSGAAPAEDPRLAQWMAADLPGRFTRLEAQADQLNQHLRGELSQLRNDAAVSSAGLRSEVLGSIDVLGKTLHGNLDGFRGDNSAAAERLRMAVDAQLAALTQRFTAFTAEANAAAHQGRETMQSRLNELGAAQTAHQERLHGTLQTRLDALSQSNENKLEQMRQTVDEKLHTTLQTRLTESFGQVTDQLTKVHAGLGEMTKLSAGVDDLSRIFTNVKSRGTIGEVMLETLLKQMLAPNQFEKNVKPRAGSADMVEFVVKLPTPSGEALLPIDSKFPREAWERLESAYGTGTDIVSAGKAFETAIRNEGRKICEKYIAPPRTTAFAIMFLPTEGLYAEVMRRDGLQTDIQQNCHVTIAGPSTLSAILNSFQMGFHMLQMQEKGDEVWKVLANARTQFGKFEDLMVKMDDQVGKVQKTIQDVGTRTRAINRTLRDVSVTGAEEPLPLARAGGFDGMLPMLAATEEE